MSTSVFYRALGIRGYKHQSIKEQDGGLVMRVRHDGSDLTCPHCGGVNIIRRGTVQGRAEIDVRVQHHERDGLAADLGQ